MRARDYIGLGPCAFCGYPDAGHRVWDAITERVKAGEPERYVADDYDLTVQGLRSLILRSERTEYLRGKQTFEEHG